MILAALLMIVAAIGPAIIAFTKPNHEWLLELSGLPAVALAAACLAVAILYFVGFLLYCKSKGYSMWVGFWLLLSNIPGFIALMLLPDLHATISPHADIPIKPRQTVSAEQ